MNQDFAPDAGRPTVIALHSSGSHGGQWEALRAELEPAIRVLTPDFRGHGKCATLSGFDEHIVAADAARIARLAEGVPGGAHLVGHSYGGAVALQVAPRHPASVRSVAAYEPVAMRVLIEQYRKGRPAAEILEIAHRIRRCLLSGDRVSAAARFVDFWNGANAWNALSERQQNAVSVRMDVIAAHFAALVRNGPRLSDYCALRVPTVLVVGQMTRASTLRIAELLRFAVPSADIERIAGLGHMGPISHPNVVARRIAAFIFRHTSDQRALPRPLAA